MTPRRSTILAVVVLLLASGFTAGCLASEPKPPERGQVVVHVQGGQVEELRHANVTLDGVLLADPTSRGGARNLSSANRTVDLVQPSGPGAVTLWYGSVPAATYDLVRVPVANATAVDADGNATLVHVPAGELGVRGPVPVEPGGTTHVVLNLSSALSASTTGWVLQTGSQALEVVPEAPPPVNRSEPAPPDPAEPPGAPAPPQVPVRVALHGGDEPRLRGARLRVDTVELRLGEGNASRWVTVAGDAATVHLLRVGDPGSRVHVATTRLPEGANVSALRLWLDAGAVRRNASTPWTSVPTVQEPVTHRFAAPTTLEGPTRFVADVDVARSLVSGPAAGNRTDPRGIAWAVMPELEGVDRAGFDAGAEPGHVVDAARAGAAVNATPLGNLEEVHLRVRSVTILGTGPPTATSAGVNLTVWNGSRWVELGNASRAVPGVTLGYGRVPAGNATGVELTVDAAWTIRNGTRVNLTVVDGEVRFPAPGRVPVDRTVAGVVTVDVGTSVGGHRLDLDVVGVSWQDTGDDPGSTGGT